MDAHSLFAVADHNLPQTPTGPGGNPYQPYVTAITNEYGTILGRRPTGAELDYWQNCGLSVNQLYPALEANLSHSAEAANDIGLIFQQLLERPAQSTDIAAWEGALGSGWSLYGVRQWIADTQEAANDLNASAQAVLARTLSAQEIAGRQGELTAGATELTERAAMAKSPEAGARIADLFSQVLGRGPFIGDIANWQNALGTPAWSLSSLRAYLAGTPEAAGDITSLYNQVFNRNPSGGEIATWQSALASPSWTLASVRTYYAQSGEAANDITGLYAQVFGRAPNATELATWQNALASPSWTLDAVRTYYADSGEASGDIGQLYTQVLNRAPTASETAGFEKGLASWLTGGPTFTVNGTQGVLATTDARTIIGELAVYVTLNGGVTPTLTDPPGRVLTFPDATALAAYALEVSLRAQQLSAELEDTYQATVSWLAQVNQPLLDRAWHLQQSANAAKAAGNTYLSGLDLAGMRVDLGIAGTKPGQPVSRYFSAAQQFVAAGNAAAAQANWNQVALQTAGADIATQIAEVPSLQKAPDTERVFQNNGSTTVDVTVDPTQADPYGIATYHSKDQSNPLGIIEPLLTAALDIVAAVSGNPYLIAASEVVGVAEAGQQFAQGNALGGVLDLGAAAVFGALGAGESALAGALFAADAVVGGTAGVVQSAQKGDGLGVAAGILEAAAGVAGGLISTGYIPAEDIPAVQNISIGLGIAGGAVAGAGLISKGDVADGLLDALGPLVSLFATNHALIDQQVTNVVKADDIAPIQVPSGGVAFVGGLGDETYGHNIYNSEQQFADTHLDMAAAGNVAYFTWDQRDELTAWINARGGDVAVVSHSWGAATAASVVAAGTHVQTLITLDPVGYSQPSLTAVSANCGQWFNFNAANGYGDAWSNAIAGLGAPLGTGPAMYATTFLNVALGHAEISWPQFVNNLIK